jgi:hypothetical protein
MTKIAITQMPSSGVIPQALAVLPETALYAYHVEEQLLYVRDDYAEAAISYLAQAGISAQIIPARTLN